MDNWYTTIHGWVSRLLQ